MAQSCKKVEITPSYVHIYFGVFRQDCNISRHNLKDSVVITQKKVELPEEAPPYYLGTVTLA